MLQRTCEQAQRQADQKIALESRGAYGSSEVLTLLLEMQSSESRETLAALGALNEALWAVFFVRRVRVVWESNFGRTFVLGATGASGAWQQLARIDWLARSKTTSRIDGGSSSSHACPRSRASPTVYAAGTLEATWWRRVWARASWQLTSSQPLARPQPLARRSLGSISERSHQRRWHNLLLFSLK